MFLLEATTQWRRWGSNPRPRSRVKHSTTESLHTLYRGQIAVAGSALITCFTKYSNKILSNPDWYDSWFQTHNSPLTWTNISPRWLQIQGSPVRSRSGPILSWRLIMKWFLRSCSYLLLIHSRRVVVSYKRKYVHELLVNRLFKPAQEKVWLGELTVPQWP